MLLWQDHNHNDALAAIWNEGTWTNLLPTNLPFALNLSNMEWVARWQILYAYGRRKGTAMQNSLGLLCLLLPNSPSSLSSFLPVFSLCPVIIAANQFNLGSEADVLMRMERCWMIPPGHYWWLVITHTANGGPDRQLRCTLWHLQMLPLCICVCVYTLYTGLCVCMCI